MCQVFLHVFLWRCADWRGASCCSHFSLKYVYFIPTEYLYKGFSCLIFWCHFTVLCPLISEGLLNCLNASELSGLYNKCSKQRNKSPPRIHKSALQGQVCPPFWQARLSGPWTWKTFLEVSFPLPFLRRQKMVEVFLRNRIHNQYVLPPYGIANQTMPLPPLSMSNYSAKRRGGGWYQPKTILPSNSRHISGPLLMIPVSKRQVHRAI